MIRALILASAVLLAASPFGMIGALSQEPETLVLFGDSITARWPWYLFLSDYHVINEGIDGDTIQDLLDRIDPVIAHNPDRLFLMIGINDILVNYDGDASPEEHDAFMAAAQQDYANLLDAIQTGFPNTRVYVQSVLPLMWADKNPAVRALNAFIEQACQERELAFIPLYDLFTGKNGQLKKEFALDVVHLTDEGYLFWVNEIMPQVLEH